MRQEPVQELREQEPEPALEEQGPALGLRKKEQGAGQTLGRAAALVLEPGVVPGSQAQGPAAERVRQALGQVAVSFQQGRAWQAQGRGARQELREPEQVPGRRKQRPA